MWIYCVAVRSPTSVGWRVLRALRTARPRVILAVGWLYLILYAYPGQMTTDTFDHLSESRAGIYTDGHPPALNVLWKLCEYLIAGPFGVLVVQSLAFLLGLYAVMRRTFSPRGAAWAATALFLYPPIMMPFAVVWKDSLMAGFLMLGVGGLLDDRRSRRLAGLAALFLASAFRYNAFGATLPLVVFLFELRPGLHWLKRYAISLTAWLAITFAAFTVNARLTDTPMHFWHSSLAVYDIVGTLSYVDRDLPDAELEQLFAGTDLQVHHDIHATIRTLFDPRDFMPIVTDEKLALWHLPVYGQTPAPEAQRDAIGRAWKEILTTYPGAYVEYRLAVMAEVLSLTRPKPSGVVQRRQLQRPEFAYSQAVPTGWSKLQNRLTYWMSTLWKVLPIYVPWLYVVLALILLPLTRKHRDVFALLASGLVIESSLLVLAPSPDYRYSHWTVICTCIAIVTLVARRARGSRGQPSAVVAGGGEHPALGGVAGERPVDPGAPGLVA
ncbi:MAG: hypothetical protein H6Q90_5275 [Deltaproteobacteria bacterium]|nr:hypothetical protein [Deltaproteobacteria bacterium]